MYIYVNVHKWMTDVKWFQVLLSHCMYIILKKKKKLKFI